MAGMRLAKLRREFAKLDPDVLAYLRQAMPATLMQAEPLPQSAITAQLYIAEALTIIPGART